MSYSTATKSRESSSDKIMLSSTLEQQLPEVTSPHQSGRSILNSGSEKDLWDEDDDEDDIVATKELATKELRKESIDVWTDGGDDGEDVWKGGMDDEEDVWTDGGDSGEDVWMEDGDDGEDDWMDGEDDDKDVWMDGGDDGEDVLKDGMDD